MYELLHLKKKKKILEPKRKRDNNTARVRDVFLMTHRPALCSGATIFWVAAVEIGVSISGVRATC